MWIVGVAIVAIGATVAIAVLSRIRKKRCNQLKVKDVVAI